MELLSRTASLGGGIALRLMGMRITPEVRYTHDLSGVSGQTFEADGYDFELSERYRRRGGSIQRIVFDKYQISIDGFNVDLAIVQAAFEQLELKYLAAISDARPARPMNPAGGAGEAASSSPESRNNSASERAARLRSLLPYRVLGLPRAGRTVIRGNDSEPLQARAVWSEDPFDPNSPYLLIKITDQSSQGRPFDESWGGPDWEYWPYGDYSGAVRTWPSDEIDEEGHPDHELSIFVPDNNGFAIEIEAYNLDVEHVYRVPDAFDLGFFESLVGESSAEGSN